MNVTPNITLSCINSGMVSSCCRTGDAYEKGDVTLYKWRFTSTSNENPYDMYESNVWFTPFEECNTSLMSHIALSNKLFVYVYIYI